MNTSFRPDGRLDDTRVELGDRVAQIDVMNLTIQAQPCA